MNPSGNDFSPRLPAKPVVGRIITPVPPTPLDVHGFVSRTRGYALLPGQGDMGPLRDVQEVKVVSLFCKALNKENILMIPQTCTSSRAPWAPSPGFSFLYSQLINKPSSFRNSLEEPYVMKEQLCVKGKH